MDEFWDAYDLWKLNKEINKSIIRSKTEAIIMKTTTNFSSKKQALEQIDHRWILPELQGVADMKYYSNYFKWERILPKPYNKRTKRQEKRKNKSDLLGEYG